MDWWDRLLSGLVDFLLTPADVVPAAIAVAAFVMSLIGLANESRYRPRVDLRPDVQLVQVRFISRDDGEVYLDAYTQFEVMNRGSGVAHDVRVKVISTTGDAVTWSDVSADIGSIATDIVYRDFMSWECQESAKYVDLKIEASWQEGRRRRSTSKQVRLHF